MSGLARIGVRVLGCMLLLALSAGLAWAGGPRFYTGPGWWPFPGYRIVWNTNNLLYYTDPGPLSPTVPHAQADLMVAAAAAAWNVPTSSLTLAQGGTLAEDVSSSNVSFDGEQVVFPADVQVSNESAMPVAVIYDYDGSLIDLLLGEGASDPEGCLQNGVVGDVDDMHHDDATIRHATLILNGRCVGSAPEQLTQLQYQLVRAFGRVLGLSWSQTNDNVFTAQSTVTAKQLAFWPLMHPLDVICGTYTYQCITDPFTLRVDDLNSLAQLYAIPEGGVPQGKTATSDDSLYLVGHLSFPTGQGMDWVNIATQRENGGVYEDWETTSGVTGATYLQQVATPLGTSLSTDSGSTDGNYEGYFLFRRIPLDGSSNVYFRTQAINPLYVGDAAVGPYVRLPVAPSGSPVVTVDWSALPAGDAVLVASMTADDAASAVCDGQDGSESSPANLDASGWQAGLLCAWGHSSWWQVAALAGHSWTLEVTATDETGAATTNKAQPVVGVWDDGDPTGTPPTIASEPVAFNSMSLGMTQLRVGAAETDQMYRLSISDQFGAGRPDFTYVARLLSITSVSPSIVGTQGGTLTLVGSGFRQGDQVLVNGAAAQVLSWSPTEIVAVAPNLASARAALDLPVTVSVVDPGTAGSASVTRALSYELLPDVLLEVSSPQSVEVGISSSTLFTVRATGSDGSSPVAGALVSLTSSSSSAQLSACQGASACTVVADADGLVRTAVLAGTTGSFTVSATDLNGGAAIQSTIVSTTPSRSVAFQEPDRYVAAGAGGSWLVHLLTTQDGLAAGNVPVLWDVSSPA